MYQEKVKEKSRTLAYIFMIGLTLSMGLFTISSALTNYSMIKPYISVFTVEPSTTKLLAISLEDYNITTSRYKNAEVSVKNDGINPTRVKVTVDLLDYQGLIIATGTNSTSDIAPTYVMIINVLLLWTEPKTSVDVAAGKVTVHD